jgi:hypothetical protein
MAKFVSNINFSLGIIFMNEYIKKAKIIVAFNISNFFLLKIKNKNIKNKIQKNKTTYEAKNFS